jgi:hypothetical protein
MEKQEVEKEKDKDISYESALRVMEESEQKLKEGKVKDVEIKFLSEKKKDYLKDNMKPLISKAVRNMATYLTIMGALLGVALSLSLVSAAIPVIPITLIAIFVVLLVGSLSVIILGSLIAIVKAVLKYIDMVPIDGVAMWIMRILVAGMLSWTYVFTKDPGVKDISIDSSSAKK